MRNLANPNKRAHTAHVITALVVAMTAFSLAEAAQSFAAEADTVWTETWEGNWFVD
jgi:hypothetical protein